MAHVKCEPVETEHRVIIKNSRQRATAARKRDELLAQSADLDELEKNTVDDLAEEIAAQIAEFDAISAGYERTFKLESLDDLLDVLVKCRLARNWTQGDLAEVLGIAEQQVQRYEDGAYEKASFWRLAEALDAMEFELQGVVRPTTEQPACGWRGVDPDLGYSRVATPSRNSNSRVAERVEANAT